MGVVYARDEEIVGVVYARDEECVGVVYARMREYVGVVYARNEGVWFMQRTRVCGCGLCKG